MIEKFKAIADLSFGNYWVLGGCGLALLISALAAARRRPAQPEPPDRPRSAAFFACAAASAGAFLIGWRHGPVRQTEVPVQVIVRDDSEISRLKSLLESTTGEHEGIVKEALATGEELKASRARAVEAEGQLASAINRCAGLEAELAALKPKPPDETTEVRRARALMSVIDRAHMVEAIKYFDRDVVEPAEKIDPAFPTFRNPRHRLDRRFLSRHTWNPKDGAVRYGERSVVKGHELSDRPYLVYPTRVTGSVSETGVTPYHPGCDTCDRNHLANEELDKLFKENPDLARIDWGVTSIP